MTVNIYFGRPVCFGPDLERGYKNYIDIDFIQLKFFEGDIAEDDKSETDEFQGGKQPRVGDCSFWFFPYTYVTLIMCARQTLNQSFNAFRIN